MFSVSAGAAALALTLVFALFGIFVRGHTYDGRQTERLNISIIETWHETWHLDHPSHWLSAWSPVPGNSASRATLQKTEISPAGSSSEDASSVFEERFSLNNPSASFGERFAGEFKSLRQVALNAVKVQLASLQSGVTAET